MLHALHGVCYKVMMNGSNAWEKRPPCPLAMPCIGCSHSFWGNVNQPTLKLFGRSLRLIFATICVTHSIMLALILHPMLTFTTIASSFLTRNSAMLECHCLTSLTCHRYRMTGPMWTTTLSFLNNSHMTNQMNSGWPMLTLANLMKNSCQHMSPF